MKTTIRKVEIPENTRLIVTSDIHGHYDYLKKLLDKVRFSGNDILFIVGDLIEKGPFSLKTLRYIMSLSAAYTVYTLMGNVDALRLLIFDDDSTKGCEGLFEYIQYMDKHWGGCIFSDMCGELDFTVHAAEDIPALKAAIRVSFLAELDFLRQLPTMIETQNFIFVHGGIPSEHIDQYAETDAFQYLKIDAFMEKGYAFNKYVVVGHWPVTLYNDEIAAFNPIVDKHRKIISIDGGCGLKRDGQLNALIIPDIYSEDFTYEAYDAFPAAYAQTTQAASADSIYIRYIDNKIKILARGYEFSYVKHESTGCELWILTDCIFSNGNNSENAACDDYTNYKLQVSIGDKLSIIKKTSKGYLVKKDGISGWFDGVIAYV
jgi:hypothetical protein